MAKTKNLSGLANNSMIERSGREMTEQAGKLLVESLKENTSMAESVNFKEDNTMSNSSDLYTTVLSKFIYTKEYDKFQKYFDVVMNLTPTDVGLPEGAGSYQIPKIEGAQATKLAPGERVEYVNKNKDHVTIETETYGIGTSISRRLLKRGAAGFVSKLMTTASNAVLRTIASELSNSLVAGADPNNTVSGGVSVDNIAEAVENVTQAKNNKGILFGFYPDFLILTSAGKRVLTQSPDFKTIFSYGQVPGGELQTQYRTYDTMNVVELPLITAEKGGAKVHALVVDSQHFLCYLRETDMDVFDGRIQGTAGDQEIIHAMDVGFATLSMEAGAVITE